MDVVGGETHRAGATHIHHDVVHVQVAGGPAYLGDVTYSRSWSSWR
jgi:hypothetical protein